MKLAYLLLCHAHPEHLIRLIEALRPVGSLFVVHLDRRADPAVLSSIAEYSSRHPDVVLTPRRYSCYWGQYNLVSATLECIRAALASPQTFDYAMLISGQDYPIKSSAEIESFFLAHAGQEFIEAFALNKPNRWSAMEGSFQAMAKVCEWHVPFRSRCFHFKVRRMFYKGWQPCGGSQWWCLSRLALEWVDQYLLEHASLGRYFAFVFIPDESMIQTMIGNSPFRDHISTELHYIDWERPNPRAPRTLDEDDFERLKHSPKLMARKLHPERSARLLRRIDDELLHS